MVTIGFYLGSIFVAFAGGAVADHFLEKKIAARVEAAITSLEAKIAGRLKGS